MHWLSACNQFWKAPFVGSSPLPAPMNVWGFDPHKWIQERTEDGGNTTTLRYAHANGCEATILLRGFADTRAVEISGTIVNRGSEILKGIREVFSFDAPLCFSEDFDQPWTRTINGVRFVPNFYPPDDFRVVDRQLMHLRQVYMPLVAMACEDGRSSGRDLPFMIMCDQARRQGVAWAVEWSGLWRLSVKQEALNVNEHRDRAILHPQIGYWGLNLDLKPGQTLPLATVLMLAFDGDLDAGGNAMRRHVRRHVTPKLNGAEVIPPTSFNHWFAFENNFNADMLEPTVKACGEAGIEYFCVDAAWFKGGFRNGIGNWEVVDPGRFPNGIRAFTKLVQESGMKYGTWLEPECAHIHSKLFADHPDWFLPAPPSSPWRSPGNNFFYGESFRMMNLGLPEVRRYWVSFIRRMYEEWQVRWIRMDMNQQPRPAWDFDAPSGELGWKQIENVTGLYQMLDEIMQACPDLFIEQCAAGGHRIDLGTARRGHAYWMNDHTTHSDIVRAMQHGLNSVLPGNYANTNLCQFRFDYTDYDFLSHCCGPFGFSGLLHEAPPEDFARFKNAISRFKQFRHLLMGDYSRPTGQPRNLDEPVEVRFRDGEHELAMRWSGQRERMASVEF